MEKNKKVVLVWGTESILSSSIQYLLAAKEEWEVISVSNLEEFNTLIASFEQIFSDIVVIHQGELDDPCNLPLQLLQEHAGIRLITISLENNVMDIYNKQSMLVKDASDLVTVIENQDIPQQAIVHASWR